jgi:iron-sulfur cluster repair protein YtfE (RIC family)
MAWDLSIWLNFICWGVCFWWMHRLSRRQEAMLHKLQDQAKRIEDVASEENTILKEVHPAVEEIHDELKEVHETMEESSRPGGGRARR